MSSTNNNGELRYDVVGYWSEVKLDIIKEYATAYSRIISSRRDPSFKHLYIDAFAGAGIHISKTTGEYIPGSPTNALLIKPPFFEYHLIDLEKKKVAALEALCGDNESVHIHHGDCNNILLEEVFPRARFKDYRRALCVLDPYGLHLNWDVIFTAAQLGSVDIFLNFPVADMNRNVLWRGNRRGGVSPDDIERMNNFWGDDSWKDAAYKPSRQGNLFGEAEEVKQSNEVIAKAFRQRLIKEAGFKNVPKPIAMKNTQNAVVYYLFFASQKDVAGHIVNDIFNKYKDWMDN